MFLTGRSLPVRVQVPGSHARAHLVGVLVGPFEQIVVDVTHHRSAWAVSNLEDLHGRGPAGELSSSSLLDSALQSAGFPNYFFKFVPVKLCLYPQCSGGYDDGFVTWRGPESNPGCD